MSVISYGNVEPDGYGGFFRLVTYSCGCNGEFGNYCMDCGSESGTYSRYEECGEYDDW